MKGDGNEAMMHRLIAIFLLSVSCHADQISGFLGCSNGIVTGEFVVDGFGLVGHADAPCPLLNETTGVPEEFAWTAEFPLQLSDIVGPGETLSFGSVDPTFSAEVTVTAALPSTGDILQGWTIFGVGVRSRISGDYCIDGNCVDFSRSDEGMGLFTFARDACGPGTNCMVLAKVGLFEVPEPSSLLLLATAVGLALLVSRSGRITHNLRLRLTRWARRRA
jgi:hypothetical protein